MGVVLTFPLGIEAFRRRQKVHEATAGVLAFDGDLSGIDCAEVEILPAVRYERVDKVAGNGSKSKKRSSPALPKKGRRKRKKTSKDS